MKKKEYVHLLEKLLLAFYLRPNPQFNHLCTKYLICLNGISP